MTHNKLINGILRFIGYAFVAALFVAVPVYAERTTSPGDALPSQTGNSGKYLTTNGSVASWNTVSGSGDVVGPASSTDNALVRFDSTTGKLIQNSIATLSDAGAFVSSISTDIMAFDITNTLTSARAYPVFQITNDSSSGVGLKIVHTDANNSQGGIRLDSPSPEIEFVETDQVAPAGKFEIRVQNDIFSINGRNSADDSFEQAFTFERLADGGRMATGGENNPAAMIEAVHTSTNPYFYASSSTSADGDVFSVNTNGVLAVGNWTNAAAATGKIQLNSNATSPSSIDLSNTIAVGTGGGGANATSKFLGQFGWNSRDSSFTAPKLVAYIDAEATETYAADIDTGSEMAFFTGTDNGTSPVERMRLKSGALVPGSSDLIALGNTSLQFSDLFLASGGVINFNNGDATITHSASLLTFSTNLTMGTLLKINAASGNPEFDFQEAGVTTAKTFYDVTNNRLTFQNSEVNTADALYFADPVTTTGTVTLGGNLILGTNSMTLTGSIGATGARSTKGWFTDLESTNAMTVGGVAVPTISSTNTLTNKRITSRVTTTASAATVTPNADTDDIVTITAQAAGLTIANPTGTPTEGQKLMIRLKDNGTARTVAFGAIYRASSDMPLPTTTILSKTMYMGFVYNSTDTKWDFVSYIDNI